MKHHITPFLEKGSRLCRALPFVCVFFCGYTANPSCRLLSLTYLTTLTAAFFEALEMKLMNNTTEEHQGFIVQQSRDPFTRKRVM